MIVDNKTWYIYKALGCSQNDLELLQDVDSDLFERTIEHMIDAGKELDIDNVLRECFLEAIEKIDGVLRADEGIEIDFEGRFSSYHNLQDTTATFDARGLARTSKEFSAIEWVGKKFEELTGFPLVDW